MKRARVELVLAVAFGAAGVAAAAWPTWIESLTPLEPDAGSGAAEWWLVAVFAVPALVTALFARWHFRAARAAQSPAAPR